MLFYFCATWLTLWCSDNKRPLFKCEMPFHVRWYPGFFLCFLLDLLFPGITIISASRNKIHKKNKVVRRIMLLKFSEIPRCKIVITTINTMTRSISEMGKCLNARCRVVVVRTEQDKHTIQASVLIIGLTLEIIRPLDLTLSIN